ncbi:MAG: hypothetical protein ACYC5Y_13835 [Symbiobacteriia bacterium]
MNWFGWVLLIAVVGGVLWWLSGGTRTTVHTGPNTPVGKEVVTNEDQGDDGDRTRPH